MRSTVPTEHKMIDTDRRTDPQQWKDSENTGHLWLPYIRNNIYIYTGSFCSTVYKDICLGKEAERGKTSAEKMFWYMEVKKPGKRGASNRNQNITLSNNTILKKH